VLGDLGPEAYVEIGSDATIANLERLVAIAVDPGRAHRGAELTIDLAGTRLSERVDTVAGDPGQAMSEAEVVAKFARYATPTLGRPSAAALTAFILHGGSAEPARACFAAAP
jgi:hypothetical protein